MRVRLFVEPKNAPVQHQGEGVCQDLDYVKALGKRIKDAGFYFMLDFHYSDSWADPANQWTPDAWKSLSDDALYTKIYEYTAACLDELNKKGATPDFIQIGNEISYGMLWGVEGSANPKRYYAGETKNRDRFISLLKQAGKACRENCPQAKIIIHTERVAKPDYLKTFYQEMRNYEVDYDIIGVSYYSYYHGDLKKLKTALNTLETNFDKDIMIVETGYYYAWQTTEFGDDGVDLSATYPISPEGQQAFTKALIEELKSHEKVKGLFWWWLEANENGLDYDTKRVSDQWYNASLFNDGEKINGKDGITYDYPAGKVMPALYELQNFLTSSAINQLSRDKGSDDNWYTLDGHQFKNKPASKGLYINNGKTVVVK
jgi:arabinogalactan endo-1,4-beta-galactosidase